jgi:predicted nucleotidyltransferase
MSNNILTALASIDGLELAVVFGSVARGDARRDSDLDIAVRYSTPLNPEQKLALISRLGIASGRPVDLIDLHTAGPVVAREALTKGKRVFGSDSIFATQLSRTLIDYADFAPLIERTLRERRDAWMRA